MRTYLVYSNMQFMQCEIAWSTAHNNLTYISVTMLSLYDTAFISYQFPITTDISQSIFVSNLNVQSITRSSITFPYLKNLHKKATWKSYNLEKRNLLSKSISKISISKGSEQMKHTYQNNQIADRESKHADVTTWWTSITR